MTLKEARQSLKDLTAWSNTLTVKQFTSNGPQDEENVTSLTEMQHDLTQINTKIGNIVVQQAQPISEVAKNDPNAAHKEDASKGRPQGRQAVPDDKTTKDAAASQPDKIGEQTGGKK